MGKMVNELDIKINRAVVTSVTIKLDDERGVDLEVTGKLISETGQEVTTFQYASNAWIDRAKIEVPLDIHGPARRLFEIVTPIIIRKIQGHFTALPSGEES